MTSAQEPRSSRLQTVGEDHRLHGTPPSRFFYPNEDACHWRAVTTSRLRFQICYHPEYEQLLHVLKSISVLWRLSVKQSRQATFLSGRLLVPFDTRKLSLVEVGAGIWDNLMQHFGGFRDQKANW